MIKRKKKKQLTPEASSVTLSNMAGIESLEEVSIGHQSVSIHAAA